MRIIIATVGTLGDHIPMIGLAVNLKRHGYKVIIACNEAMHPLALRAEIKPIKLGAKLGQDQASKEPLQWDHWLAPPTIMRWSEKFASSIYCETEEILNILQRDDVIIGPRNLLFLSLVARARNCRWVQVGLNSGAMIDDAQMRERLNHNHPWKQGIEKLEKTLRNHLIGDCSNYEDPPPLLRLHAVPEMFVPRDYPQLSSKRTGFWCWDDPSWKGWTPPKHIKDVLKQNQAPIALAFSSQPVINPNSVILQHLKVAEIMGRMLIVVKGWAFSSQALPPKLLDNPNLLMVDPLPFSWLLTRIDTVFIHGGMGTLAQALRAGCRVVIEPHGNDQFLNALLALEHNLALVVHPHRFNATEVATALNQQERTSKRLEDKDFEGIANATQELLKVL